jgi:dihydrofolate reductase
MVNNNELLPRKGRIHLILSTGYNNVISLNDQLPLTSVEETRKRIEEYQPKGPIIMGYNTFNILDLFDNRKNYVIRNVKKHGDNSCDLKKGVIPISTLKAMLEHIRNEIEPITIVGGYSVFKMFADHGFVHNYRIFLHHQCVTDYIIEKEYSNTISKGRPKLIKDNMQYFNWQRYTINNSFKLIKEDPRKDYTILDFENRSNY